MRALLTLLLLPCVALAFVPPAPGSKGLSSKMQQQQQQQQQPVSVRLFARKLTAAEEAAEEAEIRAEVDKKMRGMFNAEGKAYAPWMLNQIDVEATVRAIRRRREREREEAEMQSVDTGEVLDPVAQEMTPGIGLKYRVLNNKDVELGWLTGDERDNVGFIVFRKRVDDVGTGQFEEVASFQNFPPLNSRGAEGGFYSFVDESVEPGQYLYRVTDQDRKGKRTLLCQAGVEVQSTGDKIKNAALIAVFGALVVGGIVGSFIYEPLQ